MPTTPPTAPIDATPAPAPKPRWVPIEINKLCLYGIAIVAVGDLVALGCGVSVADISTLSGPVIVGLFAIIDRGASSK